MTDAVRELDLDHLRAWIGRSEQAEDAITTDLVKRYCATIPGADQVGSDVLGDDVAPPGIHWCLAPPVIPTADLGPDGHPRRGGFLPPVPLPRRMWAGGALTFHDPLHAGDRVRRRSRIAKVAIKEGRTGTLCFVTVEHELETPRGLAISERQDIVYRDLPPLPATHDAISAAAAPASTAMVSSEDLGELQRAGPVTLFRYSALTFNGHRIHYDRGYAAEEGYADLVVHGPLQATVLLSAASRRRGSVIREFSFRGARPLLASEAFRVAVHEADGALALRLSTEHGDTTMSATARR